VSFGAPPPNSGNAGTAGGAAISISFPVELGDEGVDGSEWTGDSGVPGFGSGTISRLIGVGTAVPPCDGSTYSSSSSGSLLSSDTERKFSSSWGSSDSSVSSVASELVCSASESLVSWGAAKDGLVTTLLSSGAGNGSGASSVLGLRCSGRCVVGSPGT
jgi:hypothetical protein